VSPINRQYAAMRRLTTGIYSEKCVVVRTLYSVFTQPQTVQYSLLHTYAIWYSLLLLGYKPVQHVTVLNTVGNCNTVVSTIILYCNIMGPPSYMRSVADRNVVMLCIIVLRCGLAGERDMPLAMPAQSSLLIYRSEYRSTNWL